VAPIAATMGGQDGPETANQVLRRANAAPRLRSTPAALHFLRPGTAAGQHSALGRARRPGLVFLVYFEPIRLVIVRRPGKLLQQHASNRRHMGTP